MAKNSEKINLTESRLFWIAAFVVIAAIYFFGLSIPLLGPDEPRYAQVAREMFERGDWVTPTLGGFDWFEKPALLYWLQIVSYNLFGVSEVAARLGSALFGLGTIAALWMLGKTLEKDQPETNFAVWLAFLAASSLGLIVFARGASFDIILTFPMTAAMVSFFIFDQRERAETGSAFVPLALFYFFIGLALLAKGLIGAVFPFAIIAFYYLLSKRLPNKLFLASLFWGGLITLAVAAVWYVPMYMRNGWKFIDEFFIQHHFQRYTSNKYFHPQPFYFFFWVLPLMTLPWLPFFFAGVWSGVKLIFYRRDPETQREEGIFRNSFTPLLLYSASWLAVPLVFFSFSGSKLPGYILPALPPAIVFATFAVVRFVGASEIRSRVIKAIGVATLTFVTAMLIFVVPRFADTDSVKTLITDANAKGYADLKVLTLYTVSHNAEFYAPGRLERDALGKQRQLNNTGELAEIIGRQPSASVLVIYPLRLERPLLDGTEVQVEKLSDNTEYGIALVTRRP